MEEDFNVIVVDWSKYSNKNYKHSAGCAIDVGYSVANLITFLIKQGMKYKDLTIIGNGMGAHVAGVAGHKTNARVGNIVGKN